MGETELAQEAMKNIERFQNGKGGIPRLCDVEWVCSTGMFQLALVWYKLGQLEKGNKIFDYACTLQNKSGGCSGIFSESISKQDGRYTVIKDELLGTGIDVCEALEHAIHIEGALCECFCITKHGGKIVIIDKLVEKLGKLKIIQSVGYENKNDGLFRAWVISK